MCTAKDLRLHAAFTLALVKDLNKVTGANGVALSCHCVADVSAKALRYVIGRLWSIAL
jgi:hypothetical protein